MQFVNDAFSLASTNVGLITWHAGEKITNLFTGSEDTVLSNSVKTREIVYDSLGLTLLAAGAAFIPVPAIQMIALPIIMGSIYGTLNNQFTVRECPEYYTMGHLYDGTRLVRHAIKTNNLLIKPIVTGCYATTSVTKFAGVLLSVAARAPYTAAVLPVSLAGAMIGGTCVLALVAAHIFSNIKKNSFQQSLDEYERLIGFQWNNTNLVWGSRFVDQLIEQKRIELASDPQALLHFNQKLTELTAAIRSNMHLFVPMKYLVGWQSNHTRNLTGYVFAGGGALAISVTSVFLRVFVL